MALIPNQSYRLLARCPEITPAAKLTMWMLMDHENAVDRRCDPKIPTLARETGLCINTTKRALGELRRSGLLRTVKGQRQSRYEIVNPGDWPKILLGQKWAGRKESCGLTFGPACRPTFGPAEPSVSLLVNGIIERIARTPPPTVETSTISTRARQAAAAARARIKTTPASELCRELLSQHPHPQQPHKAELELAKALRLAGPDDIRERHAAWRSYWNAHPEKFVPHLWRWLADGDWQTAPVAIERKPPARSQKLQVLEEYLASLKSQKAHA